jgi:hypothetical protein
VSIDGLLSGEEVLTLAEEDQKEKTGRFRNLVFGLLDCCALLLLFLPFFGQTAEGGIRGVSLLGLTQGAPYLRTAYFVCVIGLVVTGVLILAFSGRYLRGWKSKLTVLSLLVNGVGLLLFIVSQQPYGAAYLFAFLAIKVFLLMRKN